MELFASAGGPEVDTKLLYVWAVSAGRIRGEGQKVIRDLSDGADGIYTANVEVKDDTGLAANDSTKVTIALVSELYNKRIALPYHNGELSGKR